MKKIETNQKDCYILEPQRFGDETFINIGWYLNNQNWIENIKSGEYQKAYKLEN